MIEINLINVDDQKPYIMDGFNQTEDLLCVSSDGYYVICRYTKVKDDVYFFDSTMRGTTIDVVKWGYISEQNYY